MRESFESWLQRRAEKRRKRTARRESAKLSARSLTAFVFLQTVLYGVWAFAQPHPPAVSILAEFWDGVAIFCPFLTILITIVLLFSYMRSDPRSEVWAYTAAFLTASIWIMFILRPRPPSLPVWVNP